MSLLPRPGECVDDTRLPRQRWNAAALRLQRIAKQAVVRLPKAILLGEFAKPTAILSIEFDSDNETAVQQAIIDLALDVQNVEPKGYIELEMPAACEFCERVTDPDGASVRVTRLFDPFPKEGVPRMRTWFHVGIVT